jgi:hypothetical protein
MKKEVKLRNRVKKEIADDEKCILAESIVKKPKEIDKIKGKYLILYDHVTNAIFDNLNMAINLMAMKGWRCVNICVFRDDINLGRMYALMERIRD